MNDLPCGKNGYRASNPSSSISGALIGIGTGVMFPRGFFNTYRGLPVESMTKQLFPSDLPPSSPALISIQNEVREYFGWTEEDDIESAVSMLRKVEDSTVGIWAIHSRAATLTKIIR